MRLKVYSFLIVYFFISYNVSAQYVLSGRVISFLDSSAISGCSVSLSNGRSVMTKPNGVFRFSGLPNGKYDLKLNDHGYITESNGIEIAGMNKEIVIILGVINQTLNEVTITEKRTDFGFSRMRGVESVGIYEGKKSEVITPDKLVANLSTNNARQVYARVAGLNIWENEGGGLQLSIGGRGLDPNRSSNFNVRQNGHDISADALGYPESYYTPPIEGVGKIQIVRGAASLQYGTQFGGLINFIMRKPVKDKKFELTARQSAGSFGFYNAFTSASGTIGKVSYYSFFQYKRGNGWRENSGFNNYTIYSDVDYQLSEKSSIGIDITSMYYLAQQPGGLSDAMFSDNPRQSNRERNWFQVGWNMLAVHFDHKFDPQSEFNVRLFGLSAYRNSLGFRPNRVATVDDNSPRDLIKGDFANWGAEARYLKRYELNGLASVLLAGSRYYHGFNHSLQGEGSTDKDADFTFVEPEKFITYDYRFPNRNVSLFAENIFFVTDRFSVTPGIRFEYIKTRADGYYGNVLRDLAGNIINISRNDEQRVNARQFVIAGVGLSFKPSAGSELYANISQNYRSITFSDMRISNPSSVIDPNLKDEKGYSIDLGIRSRQTELFNYDISLFYLNYANRIGEAQFYDESNRVLRLRSNVGQAVIKGLESYAEADFVGLANRGKADWSGVLFGNLALISSKYKRSELPGIKGNQVEFVPKVNLKTGMRLGYKKLNGSLQLTYLSDQFSEATNAIEGGVSSVVGIIPAYKIVDLSLSYAFKKFRLEANVNNLTNELYFTRRATGYPGPGILPSDGRAYYVTLQCRL